VPPWSVAENIRKTSRSDCHYHCDGRHSL